MDQVTFMPLGTLVLDRLIISRLSFDNSSDFLFWRCPLLKDLSLVYKILHFSSNIYDVIIDSKY